MNGSSFSLKSESIYSIVLSSSNKIFGKVVLRNPGRASVEE